jgi:hypothetical protein
MVIKLARVYPRRAFANLFYKGLDWKRIQGELSFPIGSLGSVRRLLLKGVVDNWREWRFWVNHKHPVCQPTYFSFFGIFNVQALSEPCTMKNANLWAHLFVLTGGAVFKDGHHFADNRNFGFCAGQIRMLDYASTGSQEVITQYGDTIVKRFDPSFVSRELCREGKSMSEGG